jgi:hypothetical protein
MKVSYMTQALPTAYNEYNWSKDNPIVELYFKGQIPYELQLMLFLFEVGVAQ